MSRLGYAPQLVCCAGADARDVSSFGQPALAGLTTMPGESYIRCKASWRGLERCTRWVSGGGATEDVKSDSGRAWLQDSGAAVLSSGIEVLRAGFCVPQQERSYPCSR